MKKFLCVLSLVALVACSKDQVKQADLASTKVTVEPIITKATDVNFESGDAIGLSIVKGTEAYATNVKMTYDGTVFSGNLNWYAEGTDTSVFKAYYPYVSEAVPTTFTVAADQTAGVTSSDFMAATKSKVYPSANAIAMLFKHKLTKIVITAKNESGANITGMVLQNSITKANISATDFSASVDATAAAQDIACQKVNDTTYQAIIVPQTVALKLAVNIPGKTLSQKLVSLELKDGGQYSVTVRVLSDNLVVKASGDIENWTNNGNIDPDNSVSFEEFADHFVYDGVSYRTVTLKDGRTWMADAMRFIPSGCKPSSDPTDGSGLWYPYTPAGVAATDEATISANGYLYDYKTVFGKDITVDNYNTFEGAQGICPKGWHVPTRSEFMAICGYSLKSATESANVTDATAAYFDAGYSGARVSKLDTAGFHFSFSGMINKTSNLATNVAKYSTTVTTTTNCSIPAYVDKLAMSFLISSTPNKVAYSTTEPTVMTNIQFFGLMSTFLKTKPEGCLSLAYSNYLSGYQLRCIKNE
jgi:uncharacterized protein (TIGR02145 family)